MKSKRFENAISALVEAFFKGTLAKGHCAACAVGNMIHYSFGKKPEMIVKQYIVDFKPGYPTKLKGGGEWHQLISECSFVDKKMAKKQIESTGYSLSEIKLIESAFECNTIISHTDMKNQSKEAIMEDQYKGLMAVVDVLCEIEGLEPTEYKKMFEYAG